MLHTPGPLSVDRFPEGDDDADVEVDVEQCSDSEAPSNRSRTPRTNNSINSRGTPPSPSDEERLTPEPVSVSVRFYNKRPILQLIFSISLQTRTQITGSCNAEDLRPVQCHLETKELWDKFHELGTEMIITKTGR